MCNDQSTSTSTPPGEFNVVVDSAQREHSDRPAAPAAANCGALYVNRGQYYIISMLKHIHHNMAAEVYTVTINISFKIMDRYSC